MNFILLMDSYIKLRNTILALTGLVLIPIFWKFAGYRKTYFIVFFLSVFFLLTTLFFTTELDKLGDIVDLIIMSFTLELPPILLVLSIRNLDKKVEIPRWISIAGLIVSLVLCVILFIAIMAGVSGGMIG
ncbi:MAG TPA: hypothetical protein VNZ45_14285 [Bacteroidia bacterium]|nr:hypothetical protein [Bacteroidia bacterium]